MVKKKENININNDILHIIASISGGDLRKAIMKLQNLKYVNDAQTNIKTINNILNIIPDKEIEHVINICINKSDTIEQIVELTNKIKRDSYPMNSLIEQLKQNV